MPTWSEIQPFIPIGLALGGVYALSGVGTVVLYRATGVLNLASGAVGAMGAYLAWALINEAHLPSGVAYAFCVLFGTVVTLAYGLIFGPVLAARDALVKAVATLGLALVLLGLMAWIFTDQAYSLPLPTDGAGFTVGQANIDWTQVIALALGIAVTISTTIFLRVTKVGTAMRALANDREITATLGVPVRRVEAVAWAASGLLSGVCGLLLADLVALDATTLTWLVISTVAAALIARLRSIPGTFAAAMVIGLVQSCITPVQSLTQYEDMTPFVLAVLALLLVSRTRVQGLAGGGGV
jgi:branched-chain amino acid transport system permease protein